MHWAASHSTPQFCVRDAFRCAMLAFIRDLFVTSYKWPDPEPVNPLGMRNGSCHRVLEPSAFGRLAQYATSLVLAALHLYAGTPTTMTPTTFADPGHTIQIPNAVPIPLTAEQESPATILDDRLRTIESLVRGLREAGASAAL